MAADNIHRITLYKQQIGPLKLGNSKEKTINTCTGIIACINYYMITHHVVTLLQESKLHVCMIYVVEHNTTACTNCTGVV